MLKQNKRLLAIQSAIGALFARINPEPDFWTVLSVAVAGLGFASFAQAQFLLALFLFLLSVAFDAIDGAVARASKKVTAKGAFLDGVADRFVEFFILAGFFFVPLPPIYFAGWAWALLALFFGTCMTAFVKAYSEHTGVLSHEKAMKIGGVLERGERTVLILAAIAAYAINPFYSTAILALISILAAATVLQRVAKAIA